MSLALELYLEAAGAKQTSNYEWIMSCPFCGKGGHLYINSEPRDDRPEGRWICFRCGEKSLSFARLYAELETVDIVEARIEVKRLLLSGVIKPWASLKPEDADVRQGENPAATGETPAEQKQTDAHKHLPRGYIPVWDGAKWRWPEYLTQRRIPRWLAAEYGIGFARAGEYADRIIIPIECPEGQSFTARAVDPEASLRYKSGPEAGRLLFGWQSTEGADTCVITEGPFDALRVIESGTPAVSLLGKQLRDSQKTMLSRFRSLIVLLDSDAVKDAVKTAEALNLERREVRIAFVSGDPGDSDVETIRTALAEAKEPRHVQWRSLWEGFKDLRLT